MRPCRDRVHKSLDVPMSEVAPDKCAIGTQAMGSPKPAQWHLGIDFAVKSQNLRAL